MKDDERAIKKLWSYFPTVPCMAGCTDCCDGGPPEATSVEWAMIKRSVPDITWPVQVDVDPLNLQVMVTECPYRDREKGVCRVHHLRPLICRAYAASQDPNIQCKHGCRARNMVKLPEYRKIMEQYGEIANRTGGLTKPPLDVDTQTIIDAIEARKSK